jgi:hypothetical protein
MKTNLFKKYRKQLFLLLFLSLNLCVNFTPKGITVGVKQTLAQEDYWDTGYDWLDDLLNADPTTGDIIDNGYGIYAYTGSEWLYLGGSYEPVVPGDIEDVIVYGEGTDMSNFGINAPDLTGAGSDMFHYELITNQWNLWDYGNQTWATVTNLVSHHVTTQTKVNQYGNNWCVFACAEFLASHFGCPHADQMDFAANFHGTTSGWPPDTPISYSAFVGANYTTENFPSAPPSEADLKYYIDLGRPVMARFSTSDPNVYHNVVITGYANGTFAVMDPNSLYGDYRQMPYSQLISSLGVNFVTAVTGVNCPPDYENY